MTALCSLDMNDNKFTSRAINAIVEGKFKALDHTSPLNQIGAFNILFKRVLIQILY